MEIRTINSIDSLNAIAKELMNGNCIFRGTSGKEDILPNLIRHGKDLSSKEIDILSDFEKYYGIYATANTPWEFLGLAQHSWLYTRLIDFSANLYVALFFSLYSNKQDAVYKVYVFEKSKLGVIDSILRGGGTIEDNTLVLDNGVQVDQSYASLLKEEFEKLDSNFYLLEPNYRNSRMLMQQGLFVVPSPLEKNFIETKFKDADYIIEIDQACRKDLLVYLDKLGFNEYKLMPDIDSLSKEINSKYTN